MSIIISRDVGNYNPPNYWQLCFPEKLATIFGRNAGDKYLQLFLSKMATNINSYIFQKCQQLEFPEMLTIITSRYHEHVIFRNVSKYSFQKCRQYYFSEILAILISKMIAIILLEMMATNVSNYMFQKWRRMLAIRIFINIINYIFQKWQRQMLAIVMFRNIGDKC